jgi:hypothetical protein
MDAGRPVAISLTRHLVGGVALGPSVEPTLNVSYSCCGARLRGIEDFTTLKDAQQD